MSGERLERWAPRVRAGLERLPERTAKALQDRAARILREVRQATPRSLGDVWRMDTETGRITLRSDHPSVPLIEQGGTAHGSPWLAVPITDAIRDASPGGPRASGERLFTLRAKDGRLFLASRSGGKLELRWRLMERVQVRARPFVGPAVDRARAGLGEDLIEAMRSEVGPG